MFVLAPHLVFVLSIIGVGLANESVALVVFLVAAYMAGLYLSFRKGITIGTNTEAVLAVVALLLAYLYGQSRYMHYLFSLQYWLVIMLVLRAFRKMGKRDYAFCFLISAALFAHVGRTYEDVPFLFLTIGYLVLIPCALFQYLVYYGGFQKADQFKQPADFRFSGAHVRYMTGISLSLALVTILAFLLMPRPSGNTMIGAVLDDDQTRVTGFSDKVAPGSFNRVIEKQNVIMTVETDKPTLWRGGVLDYYGKDGVWYSAAKYKARRAGDQPPLVPGRRIVKRKFEMFDVRLSNYDLFSAGTILSVKQSRKVWQTWINDLYSTVTMINSRGVDVFHGEYEVESAEGEYIGAGALDEVKWRVPSDLVNGISEGDLVLQVPADISDRVRDLAGTITRGLTGPEEKADAVQRYLSDGFAYSMKDLNSGRLHPMDYFLFDAKKGHCEYFAGAMAVLLRCSGVRTRLVQGFAPGTYVDGRYVVRLSDAHLWVEVFNAGKGWKTYDPTPGREERLRVAGRVGFLEMMRIRWQSYVLRYDGTKQAGIVDSIKKIIAASVKFIVKHLQWLWYLSVVLVAVCLLFVAVRFGKWLRLGDWGFLRFGSRPAISRVRNYFGQYLKVIARKGYRRGPATTPNDLVIAMERDGVPVLAEVKMLTQLFYDTRFGGADLTRDMELQIEQALRRVKNWAK